MSLRPSLDEVMASIRWTFDQHIRPAVDDDFAQSLAVTLSNLLSHVHIRLLEEGQALVDDNDELRAVLSATLDSFDKGAPGHDDRTLARLRGVVAVPAASPARWPSHEVLTNEAVALRSALDEVLALLDHRPTEAISAYLGAQLEREARWNRDAFSGERR